jgi:hypothetical protein
MKRKAFLQTVAGGAAAFAVLSKSPLSAAATQYNRKMKQRGKLLAAGVAKKK